MPPNKYAFSGSTQGLNAPASFGENWGSNVGSPAFNNPYIAGQGINPQGVSLYDSNLLSTMSEYSPINFPSAAGSAAPKGFWGGIGDWAKDSGFVGSKDINGIQTGGWGAPVVQGASALLNGFMGMKQYGLSKKVFENNKQQFERNFSAQKGITNSQLSDRQDRRNADARANGMTGTTSTADYMSKWGVK